MGNAGTAIRPLTAALAAIGGDYTLHGVSRMHERPIGDLVDALNAAGAQIEYTAVAGYPPLRIRRGHIHAQRMQVRGNVSSQFLTALLLAAPLMAKNHAVSIEVIGELISKPYIEITLNLMRRFGVEVERDSWGLFTVQAGQHYVSPKTIHVERQARLRVGQYESRVSVKIAFKAMSDLSRRSNKWVRPSRWVTIGLRPNLTAS
jgi:3-phosphoshikimate 1-carboxyvinyltransferase